MFSVSTLARWFAEEVQPHQELLRSYLQRRFPTLSDVDNIVPESQVRLLRAREQGHVASAKAYQFSVARNLAIDDARKHSRISDVPVNALPAAFVLDDAADAAETASIRQEVRLAAEAIDTLPPRCREIVALRGLQGLSYEEIAARLGLSEQTVRVQMARGLKRCAEYLRDRGVTRAKSWSVDAGARAVPAASVVRLHVDDRSKRRLLMNTECSRGCMSANAGADAKRAQGWSAGRPGMVTRLIAIASLAIVLPVVQAASAAAAARPPNVIFIFCDDLGYGDVGFHGSTTIATPRLDRMAREGVRFTDAYAAAPYCSPSRAGLLTGRLPARAGLPYVLFPAERHGLPQEEITLAELLRERGYATACIGKWHLGWQSAFRPKRHGFDVFFGVPYSNDSNEWPVGEAFMQVMGLEPFPLMDGDHILEAPADQARLTERYTERAVAFIRENRSQPFFLYLAHTMPHIPQYASPKFAGRSKGGLYGDTIEEIDWSTGVILDVVRELGLEASTLVVFTSDNGASVRPAASQASKRAGGERFPGRSLGGSNGALRAGKGTTFEGGVRVPLIAYWHGTIQEGSVVSTPVSLMDLFPTCAQFAGAPLPSDRVYDGRDIGPLLIARDEFTPGREEDQRPIVHYFGYQPQAIRQGRWKLFVANDRRPEPRPVSLWFDHQPALFERQHRLLDRAQLYDLNADPGEANDVASIHPDVVHRLTSALREFDAGLQRDLRPMEFVPAPNPPPPGAVRTLQTDLTRYRVQ